MKEQQLEYLRKRELAERAVAKSAACDASRRVHQELAQNYAEQLRGEGTVGD